MTDQGDLAMFWIQHGDAVGVGLIMLALAVIAFLFIDHRYTKTARAQRAVYRARLVAQRKDFRVRYRALLGIKTAAFDAATTQALAVASPGPIRTPLMEIYVGQTVDAPSPYVPVWTDGGRD
jgi:hypothetical protein